MPFKNSQDAQGSEGQAQHFAPAGETPNIALNSKTSEAMQALEVKRKKKKRNKIIRNIIIVLVILLLLGLGYCAMTEQQKANLAAQEKPTGEVIKGDFTKTVSNSGTVQALANQSVNPSVSGNIKTVDVKEGDTVEEGQLIFTFESSQMEEAIEQAEMGVKQAKDGVSQSQQGVKQAIASYNSAVEQYNYALQGQIDARDEAIKQQADADAAAAKAKAKAEAQTAKLKAEQAAQAASAQAAQAAQNALNMQIDTLLNGYNQAKSQQALYTQLNKSGQIANPGMSYQEAYDVINKKAGNKAGVYDWAKRQLEAAQHNSADISVNNNPTNNPPVNNQNPNPAGANQNPKTKLSGISQHWLNMLLYESELRTRFGIDPNDPSSVAAVKAQILQGNIPEGAQMPGAADNIDTDIEGAKIPIPKVNPAPFDKDSLNLAIETARKGVGTAQLAVEAAEQNLKNAKDAYNNGEVRAKIKGEVISINVEPGMKLENLLQSGKPAAVIADVSGLKANVDVNELDILKVSPETKASITFDAIPNYTAKGQVESIASSPANQLGAGGETVKMPGAPGVVTYPVGVKILDPDNKLKVGMTANITLTIEELKDVLMVPLTAVNNDGTSDYVNKVTRDKDGIAQVTKVPVEVITSNENFTVIKGDVQPGDKVETVSEDAGMPQAAVGM